MWAITCAVRVSQVSLMSIHSSTDQTLILKFVILSIVETRYMARIARSILVRGVARNTVDQIPASSFTRRASVRAHLLIHCIEKVEGHLIIPLCTVPPMPLRFANPRAQPFQILHIPCLYSRLSSWMDWGYLSNHILSETAGEF